MFGTTSGCEFIFSVTNLIVSKYRSNISDKFNTQDMRYALSVEYTWDVRDLVWAKECQVSQ